MYGPTETTIWSIVHRVERAEPVIPVGRPIGNTRVYILDNAMQPVPPGVVGEIYLGGDGVACGYRNRPELTAERFVPDPFAGHPGARFYRTGDLGRYLADGTVVVLGRTDHQVKLRGYRIELGEIEAALTNLPDVSEAVVTMRKDRLGATCLVAYLATRDEARRNPGVLRTALRRRLPDYMVPSSFVFLATLPRTPNGKIDRAALPDPHELRMEVNPSFVAPATDTEQKIAGIWRDILALQRVGTVDGFFDLGGHSLQAVEVIAAIEQRFGVRLNPAFLQTQTLGQLAAICDEMIARGEVRKPKPATSRANSVVGAMRRMLGTGSRQDAR
jgi:acyl carrier protein